MKMVRKSRNPSFKSQDAGVGPIRMQKAIAMGKQGPKGVTKNPGSRSTGGGLKIKTKY
jgi:hypothetical protein